MADYNRAFVPPAKQSGSPNDNSGSMKTARLKFRKGERSRRMWSTREGEVLIASLVKLVAQGWKSDNGFRAGYHIIHIVLPSTLSLLCKVDANAKLMHDKPWPLWELWKQIFGKDRATGGGAAALARLLGKRGMLYHRTSSQAKIGLNGRTGSTQRTTRVKRKTDAADANLMDFLGNLHAETNARLEMISSRIGYEFDLGKARQCKECLISLAKSLI
ncbi:hypothetical protein SASPL_126766 [Salvia splendens]|uniref:Uncharacterized protein n=1 Tax=Salvia splendens TaxID=180675 RepID=A0A8X8XJF7_SALSN|nr:hypothetical protein SASPL_126766 [Salvia splendens]